MNAAAGHGHDAFAACAMKPTHRGRRQAGATVLEYAILLAVFAGVFLAGAAVLGEDVAGMIRDLGGRITVIAARVGAPSN